MKPFTLSLTDPRADLAMVGGKGMSLAKLARAGLPVPDGFYITTDAYRDFVASNGLQERILKILQAASAATPTALDKASQVIARLFDQASIPPEIASSIRAACDVLTSRAPLPVAVRSSATTEDLPGASFAGQQETYLNIRGAEAVLAAVKKCWASLWTARAIAYRLRQGVAPESMALAVVVQRLIPAEAAGILFTANPVTGDRAQAVINAAWGLGEAVVSGAVTPDTLTVARATGRVLQREIARKEVMTVLTENGTAEQPVPSVLKSKAVLSDEQAAALVRLGAQIEDLYGVPMDIEWTLIGDKFAIVQARPITTLDEAPIEWTPPTPHGVYMRASVVDLMPDPISPLFATLGLPAITAQMYPVGNILTRMKPSIPEDYFTVIHGYAYMNAGFSVRDWLWILFGMLPAYPRMLRMLVPYWRETARPQYQQAVNQMQAQDIEAMTPARLWRSIQATMDAAANYTCALMFATMGASAGSEGLLTRVYEKMTRREGDPPAAALLMGWNNLPIRSEKSLYDLAGFCRERPEIQAHVLQTDSHKLVRELEMDQSPAGVPAQDWQEFRRRFDQHLQQFGHMIFELDFAKPLPRDHPEPMLEAIKMYLEGKGSNPYERQKASEERRIHTALETAARLKGLRRWVFLKALRWAQSLSEVREDALADIGLGYPLLRRMLHTLGSHFVKAGALAESGDIFWLEKSEVEQAVAAVHGNTAPKNMQSLVKQRKAFWQKAKRSVPPPMLPPRKKYLGINTSVWLPESESTQSSLTLKGVPSSPGHVTAPARILHGPEDFDRMRPGDVLVAGTTTPAWTPLFAMASAVVTDIGGPLSHGSIVAREYGIPAVMGVGTATRCIRDGQMITVDGTAGTITPL
ncbi:MAG: hypothetical protein HPY59_07940 [Anaerolineae bacterium]|nr:hypothetical protein [Anaerolineae bacterium]